MRHRNRTARAVLVGVLACAPAAGCQSAPKRAALGEPAFGSAVDRGAKVVDVPTATPSGSMAWMDRHPLFSRPREYYETTPSNKVVKTAAATVIGVPAGLFAELRQIVVGTPSEPKY